MEVRKQDGSQYEPSCLRVMMASIDRHLREKKYPKSIARDKDFESSREVLEGIAKELRKSGKGKLPNRAQSLSDEEIEILWNSGQLGPQNPRSLLNTMWWNNCIYFGMRGREEHHNVLIEDFHFKTDAKGRVFITFQEDLTKTRT